MAKKDKKIIVKVDELKNWDKNPRDITPEGLDKLKRQIKKLGVYKPIVVNQDNIVLGGNMRLRAIKSLGIKEVWVSRVITRNEQEMLEYALSDNDRAGNYDEKAVASLVLSMPKLNLEDFSLDLGKPVDLKILIENLRLSREDDREKDENPIDGDLDTYNAGLIKQIVLYFSGEEFNKVFPRLEKVVKTFDLKNNTEAVVKLLEFWEKHQKCEK